MFPSVSLPSAIFYHIQRKHCWTTFSLEITKYLIFTPAGGGGATFLNTTENEVLFSWTLTGLLNYMVTRLDKQAGAELGQAQLKAGIGLYFNFL